MSINSSQRQIIPSEWLSQAEAAEIRGVTRQAISRLVKRGRLRAIEVAGHTLVNREDVLNFEPKEPGRPPKKANE